MRNCEWQHAGRPVTRLKVCRGRVPAISRQNKKCTARTTDDDAGEENSPWSQTDRHTFVMTFVMMARSRYSAVFCFCICFCFLFLSAVCCRSCSGQVPNTVRQRFPLQPARPCFFLFFPRFKRNSPLKYRSILRAVFRVVFISDSKIALSSRSERTVVSFNTFFFQIEKEHDECQMTWIPRCRNTLGTFGAIAAHFIRVNSFNLHCFVCSDDDTGALPF